MRVFLNEPDLTVPSAVPLWEGANWMEREVYDMFGIRFDGHPDLRRILMPEEFAAFPLRKDYPLQGRGEQHNFPGCEGGSVRRFQSRIGDLGFAIWAFVIRHWSLVIRLVMPLLTAQLIAEPSSSRPRASRTTCGRSTSVRSIRRRTRRCGCAEARRRAGRRRDAGYRLSA